MSKYLEPSFQILLSSGISHGQEVLERIKQMYDPIGRTTIQVGSANIGNMDGLVFHSSTKKIQLTKSFPELGIVADSPSDPVWVQRAAWVLSNNRYSMNFTVLLLDQSMWANEYNPDTWPIPKLDIPETSIEYRDVDYQEAAETILCYLINGNFRKPSSWAEIDVSKAYPVPK